MKDLGGIFGFYHDAKNCLVSGKKVCVNDAPKRTEDTLYVPLEDILAHSGVLVGSDTDAALCFSIRTDRYRVCTAPPSVKKNGLTLALRDGIRIIDGRVFGSVALLADVLGKHLYYDAQNGLALLSDGEDALSWDADRDAVNEIVSSFLYTDRTGRELIELVRSHDPIHGHPRVMIDRAAVADIRARLATDAFTATVYATLLKTADALLTAPVSEYEKPDGLRLLEVSRRVLDRVATLAMVCLLTDEVKYAERAWSELYACACFPDWNEYHFLDVAEMSAAFAIGYDWLHDHWNDEQKRRMRDAMIRYGLLHGMDDYTGAPRKRTYRWSESVPTNNWTMVCNAGLAMSAIAMIGDVVGEEETLCGEILARGLVNLRRALALFAPNGSYSEGANYWNYATRYYSFHMKTLQTAVGGDLGYFDVPGMQSTVEYVESLNGPAGYYNFSDAASHTMTLRPAQMIWFADTLGRGCLASMRIREVLAGSRTPEWEDLVYYKPSVLADGEQMPPDKYSDIVETMTMRSTYGADALYVGFHNGANGESHAHLDLGGFILDAQGERFICELGYDDYNLPGYVFDRYRYRAEGHNTLVIAPSDKPDQSIDATAKIVRHGSAVGGAYAIADLTSAYPDAVSVLRGVRMSEGRRVVTITDEIALRTASDIWWFAHTEADAVADADGRSVTLTKNGKKMTAVLRTSGRFEILPAKPFSTTPPVPGQDENASYRKLAIHLKDTKDAVITVCFSEDRAAAERCATPKLFDWKAEP